MKLTQIPSNLITPYRIEQFNEENFWSGMTKLLNQYNYEKDWLKKMMKIQEINNDLHTIDYRIIKKGSALNRFSGVQMTTKVEIFGNIDFLYAEE